MKNNICNKNKNKPQSDFKQFDVHISYYHRGKMCDLVSLFILNCLKCIFNDYDSDISLFRDDTFSIVVFKPKLLRQISNNIHRIMKN